MLEVYFRIYFELKLFNPLKLLNEDWHGSDDMQNTHIKHGFQLRELRFLISIGYSTNMEDGITRGLKNSGKVVSGGTEELECKTENRYRVK